METVHSWQVTEDQGLGFGDDFLDTPAEVSSVKGKHCSILLKRTALQDTGTRMGRSHSLWETTAEDGLVSETFKELFKLNSNPRRRRADGR